MSDNKLIVPQSVFAIVMVLILLASGFLMLFDYMTGDLGFQVSRNIFFGILAGIVFGLGGYLKNIKPEDFDPVKFLLTIIIGVVTGIFMYYLGLRYEQASSLAMNFLTQIGILAPVEVWLKVFVRQLSTSQ